jgi:hypothetical protein
MPEFKDYASKTTLETTDLFPISESTGVIKVTQLEYIAAALQPYIADMIADQMIGKIIAESTADLGYRQLPAEGDTIGNTGSGATYAGPEYEALFLKLKAQAGAWGNTGSESWGGGDTILLPNTQAVVLKGVGSQDINGRTKTGPAIGVAEEDKMQGHWHDKVTINPNYKAINIAGSGAVSNAAGFTTKPIIEAFNVTNPITDGVNDTPRSGATTCDNSAGVYWRIGY